MFGWFRVARSSASRWNLATRLRSVVNVSGRTLIAMSRFKRIASPVDLTHAPGTDGGEDLMRPEAGSVCERHRGTGRISRSGHEESSDIRFRPVDRPQLFGPGA